MRLRHRQQIAREQEARVTTQCRYCATGNTDHYQVITTMYPGTSYFHEECARTLRDELDRQLTANDDARDALEGSPNRHHVSPPAAHEHNLPPLSGPDAEGPPKRRSAR